ncbi:Cys-tRNA(Pro) deacylase [Caproiciproducens sp. NJN-50]|uniref:Cys-tRNA(Pro) deacylase n=1 Tax=Acutalibacteraceae TaxID=3082771 RepID=UPI000FFE044C|nr:MULTISPECIES: Cys-tRNA(Pro) deacylase [Acutalibacteraceae]QAT50872.1 Cys-tRNA(Pro) deacylase [Caproiciproducens sp. NJN-50]
MAKENKTNVMRILEAENVKYRSYYYENKDGKIDGVSVAAKLGQDVNRVFKTLVTRGASGGFFVFVLPVAEELDLKTAARSVGEKSVEMIHVSEINRVTGYIRGGCSPVGMKKQYATVLDSSCEALESMIVSGGKIGTQVELAPTDLMRLTGAKTAPVAIR